MLRRPSLAPRLGNLPQVTPDRQSLLELALIFLRLGTVAFGGPAAHIAMMRVEFVERRCWLSEGEFLDLVGASNLIPGPSSTEVALFIGQRRAGVAGLLLGGTCFILPAALIVTAIAWAYVRFGHLQQVAGILRGVKPVIIAIVAQALWALGKVAVKTRLLAALGLAALTLCFLNGSPTVLLFGIGTLTGLRGWVGEGTARTAKPLIVLTGVVLLSVVLPFGLTAIQPHSSRAMSLSSLGFAFLKVGSFVYGSGYVLLAFLRSDLVTRLHWITSAQLLDAVAIGQVTPGPVFTTATFIGYVLAGPWGALIATVSIFLPGFVFVAIGGRHLSKFRSSPTAAGFLDGVNVAAIALMAYVTFQLASAALVDVVTVCLALISAALLFHWRVNSAWLVLGGASVGLLLLH